MTVACLKTETKSLSDETIGEAQIKQKLSRSLVEPENAAYTIPADKTSGGLLSVQEYRNILSDSKSTEIEIKKRLQYLQAFCRNIIKLELNNLLLNIKPNKIYG